jgi:hypothetical protein
MDTTEIIETIDAEIARLERARALLNGHTAPVKRGRPIGSNATTATSSPTQEDQRRRTGKDSSRTKGEMGEGQQRVSAQQG